jgi:hypothetical protein
MTNVNFFRSIGLLLLSVGLSQVANAQISLLSGIPYQALLRDADGQILADQPCSLAFEIVTVADSVVWSETVQVVTDAHGLISTRVGESQELQSLPWHMNLNLRTSVDLGGGFNVLTTEPVGFVPVAGFAANGFYEQGPRDMRLAFSTDTIRFHADSLIVIGDTDVPLVLTKVIRLQAEEDVILSGRDDVVAFADDQIKLNALTDVWLNAADDVRLEAMDDVRGTAANELEMVGLRRTNIGTAAGITPTADTTTVMGKQYLNLGMPVFPPLTGTLADTTYLSDQVNIGGESIDIHGPTTFHSPTSGLDPAAPQHFVTLNYLNSAMFNLVEQVNALQAEIESLQGNSVGND